MLFHYMIEQSYESPQQQAKPTTTNNKQQTTNNCSQLSLVAPKLYMSARHGLPIVIHVAGLPWDS